MQDYTVSTEVENILILMSLVSLSQTARLLAKTKRRQVERFLSYKVISCPAALLLFQGKEFLAEEKCKEIFRNGWLSPEGTFTEVEFEHHDTTGLSVTGYSDDETACAHGWIKFIYGVPYADGEKCLFESDFDKTKVSAAQKVWLNAWLKAVTKSTAANLF